jgi:O-acetyl-ADP-ribose deacetylase (regulator of RNase III)
MRKLKHGTVELVLGDIVDQDTDAIVNAANTKMLGGGGVDGAIHRAAGPELLELCKQIPPDEHGRRCQTGHVQTTGAGNLPVKYVIHAVGPVYNEKYAEKAHAQLRQVHEEALKAAIEHDCESLAFPAISTGAYRFPLDEAAGIAIDTVCTFLEQHEGLTLVRFVLFQQGQFDAFQAALDAWQPSE